ncbi:MAG: oligosaccharide flippase family protein [Planctomycetota bacterium]
MNFARNATSLLLTSVAGVGIGFVTGIILARFLSTDDRGAYGVVLTGAEMAVLLTQVGWGAASIYRLRRSGAAPDRVVTAALFLVVAASVFTFAVALPLKPFLLDRAPPGFPAGAFYAGLFLVPFLLAGTVFSGICRGLDRFAWQNIYQLTLKAGLLLVLGILLILLQAGLMMALLGLLAVQIVASLGLFGVVARHTGVARRIDFNEVIESAKFGFRNYLQVLAGQIHERADILMIAYLVEDNSQVAFYAIAVSLVALVQLLPESFATALFPKLAGLPEDQVGPFTARVSRSTLFTTLVMVIGMALISGLFVPFAYGAEYASSVRPLLILLPAVVFLSIYRVLARYFVSLARQTVNIVTQTVSVVVNIGLNLVLIPRHGIAGAAIASVISYGLEAVVIWIAFARSSGCGFKETFIPGPSDFLDFRNRLVRALGRGKS